MTNFSRPEQLAEAYLKIGAIKIDLQHPFRWASGWRSPIYNDNRLLLFHPELRKLVTAGFQNLIEQENISSEIIAGVATSGKIT